MTLSIVSVLMVNCLLASVSRAQRSISSLGWMNYEASHQRNPLDGGWPGLGIMAQGLEIQDAQ